MAFFELEKVIKEIFGQDNDIKSKFMGVVGHAFSEAHKHPDKDGNKAKAAIYRTEILPTQLDVLRRAGHLRGYLAVKNYGNILTNLKSHQPDPKLRMKYRHVEIEHAIALYYLALRDGFYASVRTQIEEAGFPEGTDVKEFEKCVFSSKISPPAPQPGQPRLTDAETEFTQENQILHYASDADNRINVLGRDSQVSELENFLRDERRFLWLQLAGSAGQGKSRLAYDLVQRARPDFGFNAGYISAESFCEFADDWFDWQPIEPTLIVVDYVHEAGKRIGPAMAILAHRAQELKHPVRFLLLERQRWDRGNIRRYKPQTTSALQSASPHIIREGGTEADFELSSDFAAWFEQMELDKREFIKSSQRYEVLGKINLAAKQHRFGLDGVIELSALKPAELRELTKQVARHQNPECVIKYSDKCIESTLARFDNAGRPLYAYFLGISLADNSFQSSWDKTGLLERILTIYQRRRWSGEFADEPPELYEDHTGLHIAVAATIVRAFDRSKLKTWPLNQYKAGTDDKAALILNGAPRGGGIGGLGSLIPGMLPDLLGEWFVLQVLSSQPDVYERLICWCWTIAPEATASFMLRIAQDFPRETVAGTLLNTEGWNETEAARNAYCEHAAGIVSAYLDENKKIPRSALAALQLASDQGSAASKNTLGFCYWKGAGLEKSESKAVRLWEEAMESGNIGAKVNFSYCLARGIGVTAADPMRALALYVELFADDDAGVEVRFAINRERGVGIEAAVHQHATEFYRKARQKDLRVARYIFAKKLQNGIGVEVADPERAMELYQEAMDDGDVDAKFDFAFNLENGIGVETADPKRAMELYQEAINDGHVEAKFQFANNLRIGIGVEAADPKRAMDLYQEAMKDGHVGAKVNFANSLMTGVGVEAADPKLAMDLYQEAMKDGIVEAKGNFAYHLERGIGVETADPKLAMDLYQEAMKDGHVGAKVIFAKNLVKGIGVEATDYKRAMELFQEAMEDGQDAARGPIAILSAALCLELPEKKVSDYTAPPLQLANDWKDAPPIDAKWRDTPDPEVVLEKICRAAAFEKMLGTFEGKTVTGMRQLHLSCYPGLRLVDLQLSAENSETVLISALLSETGAILLDCTSNRFHLLNSVTLNIETDTAREEYLRIFCAFLRAEEGPIQIVTALSDIPFSDPEARLNFLEYASQMTTPSHFETPQKNSYGLRATALYGNMLMSINMVVYDTGVVELIGAEPIATGLPIIRRLYQGATRSPLKKN